MSKTQRFTAMRAALVPMLAAGLAATAAAQTAPADRAASAASASASAQGAQGKSYRAARASEIIGMSVRNEKGDNIGQVGDLVVDMNTGEVRYAILRFDPGILSAEKLFAVPTTELRVAADRNDVVYRMSRERLERAAIERSEWNEGWLRDGERLARLDRAWGIQKPSRGATAHRASDLIGKDVNSRAGEKIGDIEELVIDMAKQRVHYAVLAFDPSWTTPEKNFAFPLRAFQLTGDKDELVLDVDKSKIQAMRSFTDERYANLNDRVWVADIDRYLVTVLPARTGAQGSGTGESVAGLFRRLDDNQDGWLDKTEVKDSADVDGQVTRIDKNGDGRVSRDEFTGHYTIDGKR